jgi:hypothetical protein
MTASSIMYASSVPSRHFCRLAASGFVAFAFALAQTSGTARAQDAAQGWGAGQSDSGTTTITRTAPETEAVPQQVRLVALLTADGQRIDKGLVWHVFQAGQGAEGKSKLVGTHREASPTLKLAPGEYIVNAAFGRAHLTRKINVVAAAAPAVEQFVINAGGLRVSAMVGGAPAPANTVSYSIQSDRDQSDSRKTILAEAKPGPIIRLNAGIYHIVSTYGDANATVESDVTVEAGKLTEAQLTHAAARASFRLVARQGGEAVSDTEWTIQTKDGRLVKQSAGALPSHMLAPGTYTAIAKTSGKTFAREFTLNDGDTAVVEVVMSP